MDQQKELARENAKTKSSMAAQKKVLLDYKDNSEFCYGLYRLKSRVQAIFSKDERVKEIDHDTYIALDRTCFYAESGGQVSDTGMIIGSNFKARVVDVFKAPNGQHIHKVRLLDGIIRENDPVELVLDKDKRKRTECNHSSVHILQYSLQQVVSNTIKQAGSYVDGDRLRFDFTYSGKMTDDKLLEVEEFANNMIGENLIVSTEVMPLDKAKEMGAMALFSEKYKDMVRVVKIGKSIELCGGTHTSNTNLIGRLAIYNCESKGSNIYRIEAVTGDKIEVTLKEIIKGYNDEKLKLLLKAREILESARNKGIKLDFEVDITNDKPTSYKDIIYNKNELQYVHHEVKELEKEYYNILEKNTLQNLDIYKEKLEIINGVNAIIMQQNNKDINLLKSIADSLLNEIKDGVVFFSNVKDDGSVNFICKSNSKVKAGELVKQASQAAGGNGGGSPTFAQGGGKSSDELNKIEKDIIKTISSYE